MNMKKNYSLLNYLKKVKRTLLKFTFVFLGSILVTGTVIARNQLTFTLSQADSVLSVADTLVEGNYTVPSWTLLSRAFKADSLLRDSVSTNALQLAINSLKSKDMPYSINTTLNKDPKSNLGFAWFTNLGVTGGVVEIVQGIVTDSSAFVTPDFSFNAKCDSVINLNYCDSLNSLDSLAGIPNNTKVSYMSNKALATGLTPNTTYSYRVGKSGAWSPTGIFTTAKDSKDPFSFMYTTDPQAKNDAMFNVAQKDTHAASIMYPNVSFWLNCGDLVESTGPLNSEWEYEQLFETQQDIFLKIPWAPVAGNHDNSSNMNFTHHFNTDSIGFDYALSTVPGSIYSFVYGDALFMALNFENYDKPGYIDSISNWMRRQVAANPSTKWRIAFYHKTIYTGGGHIGEQDLNDIRNAMAPVFDELKIDVALQGHDHIYEVIGPIYNKQLVPNSVSNQIPAIYDPNTNVNSKSGGIFNVAKGTLYFLNGRSGTKDYSPYSESQLDSVQTSLGLSNLYGMFTGRLGQTSYPTFSNISVSTDTISIKTYTVDNLNTVTLFDSIKVVKLAVPTNSTDSLLNIANSLVKLNYTTPSWTLFKRALTTATSLKDSISMIALQSAIDSLKSKDMPYNINTTLNKDPKSNLGFAWFTNAGITGGKVEIVQGIASDTVAFATPDFSINAICDSLPNLNYCDSLNSLDSLAGIPDNTKISYMSNKALATGLNSNTTYSYRVGKPGAWSQTGTFTTAKSTKDPFSFIYCTDNEGGNDAQFDYFQKAAHVAQASFPDANFWLDCGTLVESSGPDNSEWEFEQFFQTQQDIFLKKPWAPVIGNHDISTNKNFTQHFNTDSIGFDYAISTTPGSVYSFVYGDALFMAMSFENYDSPGYLDSISNWMRQQVAANPATKWRIAFFHKNIYTGAAHQADVDGEIIRNAIAPVLDELKIDVVLQGHDRVYEVIGPIYNKQLVASAVSNVISVDFDQWKNVTGKSGGIFNVEKGTLYFLNGHIGNREYTPTSQLEMEAIEADLGLTNYFEMFTGRFGQTQNPSFSYITVSTDTINIKTFVVNNLNATLYDNIKVVKFTDVVSGSNPASSNSSEEVSIYPVPVKDYAFINMKNAMDANVEVYSSKGNLVKTDFINGSTKINLQDLAKDVYVLKVVTGTGNYTVKFVKE